MSLLLPRKGAEIAEDASREDAAFAEERDAEQMEKALEDIGELPEDWQDFVLGRIESQKVAARRRSDEDRKTLDEVFDKSTLLVLYKFINNGYLETLDYPVSTGKEANVFHATTPQGDSVAVKIFRTNTATFRSFMTYIAGDPRFGHVKPNRRDIVYVWAQKEYKNLQRYFEAGVRVPNPIAWRENVLIMEFIGDEGTPAPRVKDAPFDDPAKAYEALVDQYRLGSERGGLVHGDFSEFNILNQGNAPVVIDVAQAVLSHHPMAAELLARDAKNLAAYFRRQGVKVTADETLKRITPPRKEREPIGRDEEE
ncbi:MAG TPA: serine protein kinase RIO [Candidatus Thermoplasmatota archaeon]|nr:serine protein kinase RIO [Candidatus Thermoplasmatota archaeon]